MLGGSDVARVDREQPRRARDEVLGDEKQCPDSVASRSAWRSAACMRCGESFAMPSSARDAIGGAEADAPDVDREPIRIARDDADRLRRRSA